LPDRLGTIRDIVDNTGAIIDHVDYGAFGNQLGESSPATGDRLTGFAGLERDTATGLNLAVYRVEDPGAGRWAERDPLGFGGGDLNLYRYVGNRPSNSKDPLGLNPSDSVDATIAEYAAAGNIEGLQSLLTLEGGGLSGPQTAAINAAIRSLQAAQAAAAARAAAAAAAARAAKTAGKIIAEECKGSIHKVFPREMLGKTLAEITRLAKQGVRAAKTASKLLKDNRFKKGY
jgi:RHS repeat-associated protein